MTLTDDRLATCPQPSNLTTVPTWHPYTPRTRPSDPHLLRSSRGELKVYVEGANLPWWFDEHLSEELNRLFALPAGWDGSSSDEVTTQAVQETVAVLAAIVSEISSPPQFFPLRDGGIQVEWHVGGNNVEIEVNCAGDAYVFAERSDGEIVADGEIRRGEDEPLRVVATFLNDLSTRLNLAR